MLHQSSKLVYEAGQSGDGLTSQAPEIFCIFDPKDALNRLIASPFQK